MEKKFDSKKTKLVKVTNKLDGRVDIHRDMSDDDLKWITINPNLVIEVVDEASDHTTS